jgi:prepilin-type N-terminal cleavage/methylation domain-containing protein/prepilin-type processing-associated H-X9-DG protein
MSLSHSVAPAELRIASLLPVRTNGAFTLVELLVAIAIIAMLAGLLFPTLARATAAARRAKCAGNLRQLGLATQMYWDDNAGACFRYRSAITNNGAVYWFGWIEDGAEGLRAYDATQAALYPYLQGHGVELCPALTCTGTKFKLKAKGATYGYGYNLFLSAAMNRPARNIGRVSNPAGIALFADAAQVNVWQAPASPSNPMLEEWYYVDDNDSQPNGHFRHQQKANALFCDSHVGTEKALPGSLDPRLPNLGVGRLRVEILRFP